MGGLIGDHDDLIVHAVPNCKEKMAGKAYIDYMIGDKAGGMRGVVQYNHLILKDLCGQAGFHVDLSGGHAY